jgi:hypothetical protein
LRAGLAAASLSTALGCTAVVRAKVTQREQQLTKLGREERKSAALQTAQPSKQVAYTASLLLGDPSLVAPVDSVERAFVEALVLGHFRSRRVDLGPGARPMGGGIGPSLRRAQKRSSYKRRREPLGRSGAGGGAERLLGSVHGRRNDVRLLLRRYVV